MNQHQDIEFFIVVDGRTIGPIQGLDNLSALGIRPDTPVWYDGLDDWTPAVIAPLTQTLFIESEPTPPPFANNSTDNSEQLEVPDESEIPPYNPVTPPPSPNTTAPAAAIADTDRPKPASYLALAIAATLLCNVVAGIVAIIFACRVNSRYSRGDIDGASRASERAQWWIAISICIGLIMVVANIFTGGGAFLS